MALYRNIHTIDLGNKALVSYASGEAKASLPNTPDLYMAPYVELIQPYWVGASALGAILNKALLF